MRDWSCVHINTNKWRTIRRVAAVGVNGEQEYNYTRYSAGLFYYLEYINMLLWGVKSPLEK